MRAPLWSLFFPLLTSMSGCAEKPPRATPTPRAPLPVETRARAPARAPHARAQGAGEHARDGCGAFSCRLFDSPEAAFAHVLGPQPRVLAVGESHAQKGMEHVESATARFTRQLLPILRGRTRSLVLELMLPNPECQIATDTVKKDQRVVTERQAANNQNEFLDLGHRARALGIVPYPLRPTCEDLDRISRAGDDMVFEMLETITRLTVRSTSDLLAHGESMVVLYGGSLHNDVDPEPGREAWSFGRELQEATGGRYVAVDLIVPEFIRDTEVWRRLPWYSAFDPEKNPDMVKLYETSPGAYVLVFARSATDSEGAGRAAEDGHRDEEQEVAPGADQ